MPYQFYQFAEYPWPQHISMPEYPSGYAVRDYIRSYAQHFGIMPHIRWAQQPRQATPARAARRDEPAPPGSGTPAAVRPPPHAGGRRAGGLRSRRSPPPGCPPAMRRAAAAAPRRFRCQLARLQQRRSGGWHIIYMDHSSGLFQKIAADFVVVCTGIYSLPFLPAYQGSDNFKGVQVHAKDFLDRELARGKRVVVVSGVQCSALGAAAGRRQLRDARSSCPRPLAGADGVPARVQAQTERGGGGS